jgi:hypothetical protein
MWTVSTYRPVEIGEVEVKILRQFAENDSSFSVYQIFKGFKQDLEIEHEFLRSSSALKSLQSARKRLLKKFEGNNETKTKINNYYFNFDIDHLNKSVKKPNSGPASYKNIHKRVIRLAQLKLIGEIKGDFKRGAKHYRISTYGLTYFDKVTAESEEQILLHIQHLIIRALLLRFFQQNTLESFYMLKEYPTKDIGDYLHDCCSTTTSICKEFWTRNKQYQIDDILPPDEIIQQYMAYLDGESVDQYVLNSIKEYEIRLLKKLDTNTSTDNTIERDKERLAAAVGIYERIYFTKRRDLPYFRNYAEERPPFPLLDIYYDIVWKLYLMLDSKIKSLAHNLVYQLGEIVKSERVETQKGLEEEILEKGSLDFSIYHILRDKKFFGLIRNIKDEFDIGYKQFLYYHT